MARRLGVVSMYRALTPSPGNRLKAILSGDLSHSGFPAFPSRRA